MVVDGEHLRLAAQECAGALAGHVDADWTAKVPGLNLTVAQTIAHAAEACLWFAIDLAAAGPDLGTVECRVKPDRPPPALVAILVAQAGMLAAVVDDAPPERRGFHPMGPTDASGYVAMVCDELLIHTDDVVSCLGSSFSPDQTLARAVLARLFPWIEPGDDPWRRLRWANGRTALGQEPRLDRWAWFSRPLDEWDRSIPEPVDGLS